MNDIKTYRAYGVVTGGKYLGTVEAINEEEAKKKALELESCRVSLCHYCSDECDDPQIDDVNVEVDE